MNEVLTGGEQVTPEWLTRVLRAHGCLHRGKVVAVQRDDERAAHTGGPGYRPGNRLEVHYWVVCDEYGHNPSSRRVADDRRG